MKVTQIVSTHRRRTNANQMEVIAEDDKGQRTLHIHRKRANEWYYFAGCDKNGNKVFLPITV